MSIGRSGEITFLEGAGTASDAMSMLFLLPLKVIISPTLIVGSAPAGLEGEAISPFLHIALRLVRVMCAYRVFR
jgi:hypothetical protein